MNGSAATTSLVFWIVVKTLRYSEKSTASFRRLTCASIATSLSRSSPGVRANPVTGGGGVGGVIAFGGGGGGPGGGGGALEGVSHAQSITSTRRGTARTMHHSTSRRASARCASCGPC